MSNHIEISVTIPTSDNQRESAGVMAKLDVPVSALEAAITEATGHAVKVGMKVVRRKDKGAPAAVPVVLREAAD